MEIMPIRPGVFSIKPEDFSRVLEVWEASVRATQADIQFFRPLIRDALPGLTELACVRDLDGRVAGFINVEHGKVEMLFLHPAARGQGAGKRLLRYAVEILGATTLDVNEQNDQAVGFYLHMGFEVTGRSDLDGTGKPYPLLHMRLRARKGTTEAADESK